MTTALDVGLLDTATRVAKHYLREDAAALDYLENQRSLDPSVIDRWNLGKWVWPDCGEVLTLSGFTSAEQEDAGLGERLAGRITVPLADPAGRTKAMVGRTHPGFNHPVTWLYPRDNKHFVRKIDLLGLIQILDNDLSDGPPLLVEGPFDVILSQANGFNAMSPHGSTFTEDQAMMLRSFDRKELILVPDPDVAGFGFIKSARKHRKLLPDKVLVASLPPGLDPADFIAQEGVSAFQTVLRNAYPLEQVRDA